jgi:adhesin HecA-like repeat protein
MTVTHHDRAVTKKGLVDMPGTMALRQTNITNQNGLIGGTGNMKDNTQL